jgi:hypothetical protein
VAAGPPTDRLVCVLAHRKPGVDEAVWLLRIADFLGLDACFSKPLLIRSALVSEGVTTPRGSPSVGGRSLSRGEHHIHVEMRSPVSFTFALSEIDNLPPLGEYVASQLLDEHQISLTSAPAIDR